MITRRVASLHIRIDQTSGSVKTCVASRARSVVHSARLNHCSASCLVERGCDCECVHMHGR